MLMTRDQAAETWCPMTRAVRHEPDDVQQTPPSLRAVGGCNTGGRGARVPASCRCIADKCAMWRWSSPPRHDPFPTPAADVANEGDGFCGLAGRPV